MTKIKARNLGRLYFFLVSFVLLIPVSYGLASIHVLNEVAETYITYDSEGDPVTNYKLETVSDEDWIVLKQEQRRLIDIVGAAAFITSISLGGSFGEDVIINDQPASFTWDERSRKMFVHSLLVGALIWHPIFIMNRYGFSFVIVPKIFVGAIITTLFAFAVAGNVAVHFGESIIHKLLTLHKS